MTVTVPTNGRARVWLNYPAFANPANVTVTEGAAASSVWARGSFVPGVPGVLSAAPVADASAIEVAVLSGTYNFVLAA